MIEAIRQGLKADGFDVPSASSAGGLALPGAASITRQAGRTPKVDPAFSEPIRALIEEEPSFGYRTVANLLRLQQEHGPEDLPAQGLAGQKAAHRSPAADRCRAVCCNSPGSTLGDRPLPGLGWSRWLADAGPGHRLPHPRTARLAALALRQGLHRRCRARAGLDCPLRNALGGSKTASC